MPEHLPPILLVGGGRMGGALLAGWRAQGLGRVVLVDPSPAATDLAGGGVTVVATGAAIPADFAPQAVVLAIKPQAAAAALPAYAHFAGKAVFISIMAGQSLGAMASRLGGHATIIRAMPNTPAAIGQGFTVAAAGLDVSAAQRALADKLLSACGQVAWVADEALLDPVTAISGGGPAYVFLLAELMEQAAIDHGIAQALARSMARQTIIGAAALLAASDEDASTLRVAVTSPGGTTEQALAVLRQSNAWPQSFGQAINAATARSRALSA